MDSYQNYVNLFSKLSPNEAGNNGIFKGLSDYSTYINEKANEIVCNAADDKSIDCSLLQKEIFQMGVAYVKIFAMMSKTEKPTPTNTHAQLILENEAIPLPLSRENT